jgi:hypothetical protein
MNISLIDDGVHNNSETRKFVKEFLEINESNNKFCKQISKVDLYSHGTMCAFIIRKFNKFVQIYSLKILDSNNLSASSEKLVKSFEWCLNNDIKIINLSLGTVNSKDFIIIANWVQQLAKKGIIIIAATNNNNTYTIPASLPNVIGVSSKRGIKEFDFINNSIIGIDILAASQHYIEVNANTNVTTPYCNSYAAPAVTGKISEILNTNYSCLRKNDKYFFYQIKLKIRQTSNNIKNRSIVKYQLENLLALNIEEVKSFKSVPIIYIKCNEYELENFIKYFYKDNIFSISIYENMYKHRNISRSEFYQLIKYISTITDCDIVILNNTFVRLKDEDLSIEVSERRIKLLYKNAFKRVEKYYLEMERLYLDVIKLLE